MEGGNMTTPDEKNIVQRLEKVEKQNRRYKVLNVFVFFLFFGLMVTPRLSAVSWPSLDPLWNAINDINDFIKFENDMKSKKFVAQSTSSDDKPRSVLNLRALEFYDYNGNRSGILRAGTHPVLGIGTGDPKRPLHVSAKKTMVQLRLERTVNAQGIVEMGTANGNFYLYPGGYYNKDGNVIFDTKGYVGIGVQKPQAQLHVDGIVKASNINTGDIVFQKDGKKLWRMFEDEKGLYLENIKTLKVYSFVLKEVK